MRELNAVESLDVSGGFGNNPKHDCISLAVFGGLFGFWFAARTGVDNAYGLIKYTGLGVLYFGVPVILGIGACYGSAALLVNAVDYVYPLQPTANKTL